MLKRKLMLFIVGISLMVVFAGTAMWITIPAEASPQPKTLKIGTPISLSGWFSFMNIVCNEELHVMAEIINEDGGIMIGNQQYLIEIISEDAKSTLDGYTAATTKLVLDHGVRFIVGPNAFFSTAVNPTCEQNQVLHVLAWCTTQPGELDKTTLYGFAGNGHGPGRILAAVEAMVKLYPDVKKVTAVCPDDGQIPYITPILDRTLKAKGLTRFDKVVGFSNEIQDYAPVATKLNSITGADAYIQLAGMSAHLAHFGKAMRELGNTKPWFGCVTGSGSDIISITGKANAQKLYNLATIYKAPGNPPILDKLLGKVRNKLGEDTPNYLEEASALYLLVQAMKAAQSIDPTKVKEYWETQITNIDTIYGPGVMGGKETYGIANHAVSHPWPLQIIDNGEVSFGGFIKVPPLP